MSAVTTKYWIGTVSREHVRIGVEGGFCQVCHGKKGPLARMGLAHLLFSERGFGRKRAVSEIYSDREDCR